MEEARRGRSEKFKRRKIPKGENIEGEATVGD